MAPARDLVEVSTWNLSESCRQKSRSHLALFEAVDRTDRGLQRHRQTEHHNAFGYLGESIFSTSPAVSSSCHQLPVRSSPESLFWRLSPETTARLANTKAGRNESSAIFAVMGQGEKPPHSPHDCSSGQQSAVSSPLSEEKVLHSPQRQQSPSIAADNSLSPLHFPVVSRAGTAFDDYHHNLRNYQPSQHHHHYPQTSTPLGHHHRYHLSKSVFSVPFSAMSAKSSQNRILIKGGKCVNDDAIFDADIYIEEGIIRDIGPHLIVPGGVRTIDARGLYILPGGIDTHTHLNMPFMGTTTCDDFYSGTKAALAGGTTTVMDFVIPPKGVGLVAAFKKWNEWAKENACCDYAFRVAISEFKKGKTEAEMEALVKEYGVNAFKCFMAYKGDLMLSDEELIAVFAKCRELGALALVHAENGEIIDYNVKKLKSQGVTGPEGHLQSRPEEVEAEATNRAIVLANQVNCPLYVVHVMSRSAADVLASARNRGCLVLGESITAGFGTDGSHYFDRNWRVAAAHVLSPPLRLDQTTSEHLIHLLASGQLQTTGSDHCTFSTEQKEMGAKDFSKIPNGVNGVEERLLILWEKAVKTGVLDVKQFVAVTSTNAAKYFNIYPRKGRLAKGSDADIVIWGPKSQTISAKTHHSNVDFNIFEGMHVSSGPQVVISNGKVVLDESGFHVTQGAGRLLSCPPSSPYLYGVINTRAKNGPIKVDRSGKAPVNEAAPPALAAPSTAAAAAISGGAAAGAAPSQPVNGNSEQPKLSDLNTLAAMSVHDSQEVSPTAFYKGSTRSGVRNLQDSSFNLNGQQIDDDKVGKSSIRVHNPPGGRSSGIW